MDGVGTSLIPESWFDCFSGFGLQTGVAQGPRWQAGGTTEDTGFLSDWLQVGSEASGKREEFYSAPGEGTCSGGGQQVGLLEDCVRHSRDAPVENLEVFGGQLLGCIESKCAPIRIPELLSGQQTEDARGFLQHVRDAPGKQGKSSRSVNCFELSGTDLLGGVPCYDPDECLENLKGSLGTRGLGSDGFEPGIGAVEFGLSFEKRGNLTAETQGFQKLVRYLNGFVEHHGQGVEWTTLRVLSRCSSGTRSEGQVAASSFWMMALGKFQGGGVWLESLSHKGPVIWEFWDGRCRSGQVQELRDAPVKVQAGQGFALESWTGGDLWVLQACVAPGSMEVGEVVRSQLLSLGFH